MQTHEDTKNNVHLAHDYAFDDENHASDDKINEANHESDQSRNEHFYIEKLF
mgnify:FL=1